MDVETCREREGSNGSVTILVAFDELQGKNIGVLAVERFNGEGEIDVWWNTGEWRVSLRTAGVEPAEVAKGVRVDGEGWEGGEGDMWINANTRNESRGVL